MRNKGLHRGADEIGLIKKGILAPTEESILKLCADIGDLRGQEARLWKRRGQTYDLDEQNRLAAEMTELLSRIQTLMAELERKMVLMRVFKHLVSHRATEVQREYMDPALQASLSHGEGLLLRDLEANIYA